MDDKKVIADNNRISIVNFCEGLYPPDSEYTSTQKVGRELLLDSIFENWRTLPIEVLISFREKSIIRDAGNG